ncbi:MAG: c-type cytochrome [Sandaracinaceae bacterium]|nr:c-type cytochrome [Sandaracinaceae bacterium]
MTWTRGWALAAVCAALLGGCGPQQPQGDARGPRLFETCAACHGAQGEGNQEFGGPAIAGMPEWYLLRQLNKFRAGHRGSDPQDRNGLRMRGMARTLNHEGDVEAIAAYVASMPPQAPEPVLGGNAENGRELYQSCVQCHGGNAAGNIERDAPPLTSLNDWYIVAQLSLFKAGDRGTSEGDATGATMRPMAIGLADETQMADVAAFIATLRGQ